MALVGRLVGMVVVGVLAGLVAGCSSLGLPSAARAPSQQEGLDYLNDDLGALVLAFDVPETLEPVDDVSQLTFVVAIAGQGERRVVAKLTPADASEIADTLPPPGDGRTYYLLGFADADKAKLREAQSWARSIAQTGVAPETPVMSIAPGFCSAVPVDPKATRISVLLALPGHAPLPPLLRNQTLATLLAPSGASTLPACAGHSG
jgi:hypothetical protein